MARLGDLVEQIRGVSYKPEDVYDNLTDDSVALLRANNIKDGQLDFQDIIYISKKRAKENQYLKAGDTLICTSSGSKDLVGKAAYVEADLPMVFGAFCKVVRPKIGNARYLGHFFDSPYYRNIISDLSSGANINNIRNEHIDELEIRLPPAELQIQAVEVLNLVNSLISLRKQQLAKLDDLVKARFVEMFGDPIGNPFRWQTKALSEVCDGIGDGLHGTPVYDENGNYPFINGNNLVNGRILITPSTKKVGKTEFEKYRIDISKNAILISINGTLGKLAFYNGENVVLGKSACYCNLKEHINKIFVYAIMNTDSFREYMSNNSTESTIKNVGLKSMRSFRLICPPSELQGEFSVFWKEVEKCRLTVQQGLDKLEAMKKALMQEYFG